ncbi:MAG: hypothetical protein FWE34_08895 [Defluviitaleaceae bacterium]|nr:hypothetical protein [Defluviitaleaceae bacterium]
MFKIDNEILQLILSKLTSMEADIKDLKQGQIKLEQGQIKHDQRLDNLEQKFSGLEQKFSNLEQKFSGLEQKFSGLEQKFSGLEQKFSGLEQKFSGLEQKFSGLEQGLSVLADKHDNLETLTLAILHNQNQDYPQLQEVIEDVNKLKNITHIHEEKFQKIKAI